MSAPYRLTPPLPRAEMAALRRRAIFECCKWDPQVEDTPALAPECLVLEADTWTKLARMSETLARETLAAEDALVARPRLHRQLGLPRSVRRALEAVRRDGPSRGAARVMRFDFHFTTEGWRISEVNSDVPGGFVEAGGVASLMAEAIGEAAAGDPAQQYARAVLAAAGAGAHVALVHATAYTDDREVVQFLARRFAQAGLRASLIGPDALRWDGGRALVETGGGPEPVDLLVRFFPGEWLHNLPRGCGARRWFAGAVTPMSNPATALVTQSKRFPLVWDELDVSLDTWRALLPQTRDPRAARRSPQEWILKPALGRMGEGIGLPGMTAPALLKRIRRAASWWPSHWIAQRPFDVIPVESDRGPMHPCIGVYVIDGRVAGAYGRMAPSRLIDHMAQDVAVLISATTPANASVLELAHA